MGAAGMLRADNVVFYHPLDDFTERTQDLAWSGSGAFTDGKIGDADSGVTASAPTFGASAEVLVPAPADTLGFGPNAIAAVDAERSLLCYRSPTVTGPPATATVILRVATVSGGHVALGPEYEVGPCSTGTGFVFPYVVYHGGGKFVAFFWGTYGTGSFARAGTVDGASDITFGATIGAFTPALGGYMYVAALTASLGLMSYTRNAGLGVRIQARAYALSGLDVTLGAEAQVNAVADSYGSCVARLTDSTAAIAFKNGTASGGVAVLSVSGTAVAVGAASVLCATRVYGYYPLVAAMSADTVVVSYYTNAEPAGAYCVACGISGGVVTVGARVYFGSSTNAAPLLRIDSSRFVLCWRQTESCGVSVGMLDQSTFLMADIAASGAARYARIGTVSGTSVALGSTTTATYAYVGNVAVGLISQDASIAAPATDAFGFGPEYAPASTGNPELCLPLDGTHVLCVGLSRSVVATIDGAGAVTFGPAAAGTGCGYSFSNGDVLDWDGTTGHAVSFWATPATSGYTVLYTISAGMNITVTTKNFGDPPQQNPARGTEYGSVAAIDSTRFLLITRLYAIASTVASVCTRTGGNFAFGPNIAFPDDAWVGAITRLDSSRLLVFYMGPATSSAGKARVATVSGTDVTFGASAAVNSAMNLKDTRLEHCGAAAVGPSAALLLWTNGYSPGYAKVATVSGTAVEVGAQATTFEAYSGSRVQGLRCAHMGSGRVCSTYLLGSVSKHYAVLGEVKGPSVSFVAGAEFGLNASQYGLGVAAVSIDRCATFHRTDAPYVRIGDLLHDAYPKASGEGHIAVAMWAKNPTKEFSTATVRRDYTVALTATSITLGPASAAWSGTGIESLMEAMNTPSPDDTGHLLVLDFQHAGSGSWTLRTSIDGGAWADRGAGAGARTTLPFIADPRLQMSGAGIQPPEFGQWIDELAMWAGDFDAFTAEELANLHDLADVFGDPMDQYEDNFGAPICWQATARMPDGSAWRDSGCGRCPPVVRVPRGASDVVVTDDGNPASPRIVEG